MWDLIVSVPDHCLSFYFKSEATFLGFRVTGECGRPDPNNVANVLQWPLPANIIEVKRFLGL